MFATDIVKTHAEINVNAQSHSSIFNPVSRDFVLMRMNVNPLNRGPEHDCQTFSHYTERNVN